MIQQHVNPKRPGVQITPGAVIQPPHSILQRRVRLWDHDLSKFEQLNVVVGTNNCTVLGTCCARIYILPWLSDHPRVI